MEGELPPIIPQEVEKIEDTSTHAARISELEAKLASCEARIVALEALLAERDDEPGSDVFWGRKVFS